MKKLTPMQEALEKEIRRIKRLLKKPEFSSIRFSADILERPSRVTKTQLELRKSITPKLLESVKAEKATEEITARAIRSKTQQLRGGSGRPKIKHYIHHPRKPDIEPPKDPEKAKEARRRNLQKAREAYKRKLESDPVFAETERVKREARLQEAREAYKKKLESDPVFAELEKAKRAERLKKAREAYKKKIEENPIFAESERKRKAEILRKAREKKKQEVVLPEAVEVSTVVLYNVRALISSSSRRVARLLTEMLDRQIQLYGELEIAERFMEASARAIMDAEIVIYDSNPQNITSSAESLALLIDENARLEEITAAVIEEFGYRRWK